MGQLQEAGDYAIKATKSIKIRKALTTTLIGSISILEENIGKYLWGHGKDDNDCSNAELAWRKVWIETRKKMLDKGNDNIRKLEKEIGE